MTREFVYDFIKLHDLAVLSTLSVGDQPEAALVGIVVSENLEIIFDTVKTSRKYKNLLQNPLVALVIGWENETTLKYEGTAIELKDTDDDNSLKEIYFAAFNDGRERAEIWPGVVHFKTTPNWIRYSNFNEPVMIEEMKTHF